MLLALMIYSLTLGYNSRRKMNNHRFILILLVLLLAACNKRNAAKYSSQNNNADSVAAVGRIIPNRDAVPPAKVRARNLRTIAAGKPTVVNYEPDIQAAVISKTHLVKFSSATEHEFEAPLVNSAVSHPVAAGVPEIIVARHASFNDNDPGSFSSFKSLQGLRQPLIRCIMQDTDGNIWFGTYSGGISKYDGKYFTNYTIAQGLSNDGVWSMLEDHERNIWMATLGGGIIKFDGTYFTTYKTTDGLCDDNVYCLCEDDKNNIWIGTKKGLSCFNGKTFTSYSLKQGLPNELIHTVLQDRSGTIWVGTNQGAAILTGSVFQTPTDECLGKSSVNTIFAEGGNIWFGTGNGLVRYNASVCETYSIKDGAINNIMSICRDKRSNLWIGTYGGGVYKFDGNQFTHFTTLEGLSNNKVTSVLADRSGTLWLGTNGGGACRYDGELFTHFTMAQGLAYNEVKGIAEDKKGNLWFATWGGGVSKYDGKAFENFGTAQGMKSNNLLSMLIDSKGNLWFGSDNGITQYDGTVFTNYDTTQGFSSSQVWSIHEDKQHNMWFGTFGDGAYKFDGNSFTHYSVKQGLGNPVVMCLLQDRKGNMWFGTYGNGLYKYDGKTFTNFSHAEGLSSDEVMDMIEDKQGNLWIGTIGGGVNKYDGRTFTHYSTAQGLSNEIVMGILQDKKGRMWFSTRNGLNRMMPDAGVDAQQDASKPIFKNYLFEDGLLGVNTYVNALYEDSKNSIWIGTGDRLTRCTPAGEIPDTIAPTVEIIGVSLYNEKINWLDLQKKKDTSLVLANGVKVSNFKFDNVSKWYNVPEQLSLAHNNNYLVFDYIGISTKSPYDIKYKYKLEGIDRNWNALTDRTEAPYGNIPHGKYTFKVKAMNSEGFWSNEYAYPFEIRPAWWQTLWFRIFVAFVAVGIVYGIYRFRLSQVLRLQNIRNKIASDLHDDIGSTLNSISVYSDVAKTDSDKREHSLNMIGESSRKVIDTMSDIVWTINPDNDSFEKIILRMRSLAHNLLRAKNIELSFKADESLNHLKLSLEKRRNFYLIFKEAINNLIKYSEAKRVSIWLTHGSGTIILKVSDDGIGFDTSQKHNGNGLASIRKRAKELNAQFDIASAVGTGTHIQLTFKS